MFKKLMVCMAIVLTPIVAFAADKGKKDEPVVHLTDEQIYEQLKNWPWCLKLHVITS